MKSIDDSLKNDDNCKRLYLQYDKYYNIIINSIIIYIDFNSYGITGCR